MSMTSALQCAPAAVVARCSVVLVEDLEPKASLSLLPPRLPVETEESALSLNACNDPQLFKLQTLTGA